MTFHRRPFVDSEPLWADKSFLGSRIKISTKEKLRLWFLTLFYHKSISYEYALDTLIEPLFWFVDNFTHLLGPAFVTVVVTLVGSIVVVAHVLGLPFWYKKSPILLSILIVIGYWILMNLIFNFYKVATVSPGLPNDPVELAKCPVTICKKCIGPKPNRTHHCSICSKCYLNMGSYLPRVNIYRLPLPYHHCPWVNNCVGHFNRRYFFLCMAFIVMGCCYIMLFGVEIAFREVFLDENVLPYCINEIEESHSYNDDSFDNDAKVIQGKETLNIANDSVLEDLTSENCDEEYVLLFLGLIISRHSLRLILYYAGVLCISTSLALGGLSLWHAKLITMGETSIEYHINRSEREKNKKTFVNSYDLGKKRNWEVLFGLDQPNITFFRHILFPSSHLPTGNGYDWSHITVEAHRQANIRSTL